MKGKTAGQCFTAEIADTFWRRFLGLMGRREISPQTALLIRPCNSIHMFFMRFAIDAVFIDENFCVKKVVPGVKPWFGFAFCFGATAVLEFAAGEAARLKIEPGCRLTAIRR